MAFHINLAKGVQAPAPVRPNRLIVAIAVFASCLFILLISDELIDSGHISRLVISDVATFQVSK